MSKSNKNKGVLLRQNHENNYDDGRNNSFYPTQCAQCCCYSCTGFACPWDKDVKYVPAHLQVSKRPKRCAICRRDFNFKRLYDCDYYTYYKRKRFYLPRKVKRRKKKIDLVLDKVDEVLRLLKKLDGGK
ncbi:MAG: hypothetical protein FWH20_10420 [Oscillospiraceae bacterium]|nr:hypothetical protein [Oscillospiraceae bacterium]